MCSILYFGREILYTLYDKVLFSNSEIVSKFVVCCNNTYKV